MFWNESRTMRLLFNGLVFLCLFFCVSCKEKIAIPAGWSAISTPNPDSLVMRCANYSKQNWRVFLVGNEIGIENSDSLHTAQSLPDNFKRTSEMVGNSSVISTTDGLLIGFDGGEFGGGLWWSNKNGSKVSKLMDAPVKSLMTTSDGVFVFTGIAHMGLDNGKVWVLRNASVDPKPALLIELDGAPRVVAKGSNRSFLVATTQGVMRVFPEGKTEVLMKAPSQFLYPGSIVETPDHQIYVGMRLFVVHLSPERNGYMQQWLVQRECRETRIDGYNCVCTAPKGE
jgi:hypothetical protein